jgi:hypothetical protein
VRDEVLGKARTHSRFAPARSVWMKLEGKYLSVLSDDITDELAAAVQRLTLLPMSERMRDARDLGETMVVAHASVIAQAGSDVSIIIDDTRGAQMATIEQRRLNRLRAQGQPVGSISMYNTTSILEAAGVRRHIPDKATMRAVYGQLRACDDGLIHISQTGLLSPQIWS